MFCTSCEPEICLPVLKNINHLVLPARAMNPISNFSHLLISLFCFTRIYPTFLSYSSYFNLKNYTWYIFRFSIATGHNLLIHQESRHAHCQFLLVTFLYNSVVFDFAVLWRWVKTWAWHLLIDLKNLMIMRLPSKKWRILKIVR